MKEKTVNYVVVEIRKIHKKHPAVSSTTEPASSASGSLPYNPATSSGAAKLITALPDTPTTTSQRPTPKPRGSVGEAMGGAGAMHPTPVFTPTTFGGTMQPGRTMQLGGTMQPGRTMQLGGPITPTFGGTMQPGGTMGPMKPALGAIGHPRISQHCDIQGLQPMKPQLLAQVVPPDYAATAQPPQPPQDYETSRPALFKIANVVVKSSK